MYPQWYGGWLYPYRDRLYLFTLITSLMTLWNYTGNLFAFWPHTMELITNKNDEITAYRILSSPEFKYQSFVTLVNNQLVLC